MVTTFRDDFSEYNGVNRWCELALKRTLMYSRAIRMRIMRIRIAADSKYVSSDPKEN